MSQGPSGLLLVDKPKGFTSHDVVAVLRRVIGTKKVGHAGTLDPMATGLLLMGIGSGTKFLHYLTKADKRYLATVRLGQSTVTDDAEGETTSQASAESLRMLSEPAIDRALGSLSGVVQQVPSSVSAIKTAGVRSYDRVRAGEKVSLPARQVEISELRRTSELRRSALAVDLDIQVACSSGTYIRAIARDLGAALEVGGHLIALQRTAIGKFSVAEATPVSSTSDREALLGAMLGLSEVAETLMQSVVVDGAIETRIRQGQRIALGDLPLIADVAATKTDEASAESGGENSSGAHESGPAPVAVISQNRGLIAICEPRCDALQPLTVFEESNA